MTNPMANPEPVPQRFGQVPPASIAKAHEASHSHSHAGTAQNTVAAPAAPTPGGAITEEDVFEAMRDVIDPELGINVVDLGLVYGCEIGQDRSIVLDMTLTSAACPLTDVIEEQTAMVLSGMSTNVGINWVWMPPWGPECITAEGREQLRALGFNV
ncbi:MAG: metal-sulfur cluster assembly factor [Actinomycetaceae bacterium]|nr:metal-sulfur cluster assembly factor [Actinomycetaceae bacterium]